MHFFKDHITCNTHINGLKGGNLRVVEWSERVNLQQKSFLGSTPVSGSSLKNSDTSFFPADLQGSLAATLLHSLRLDLPGVNATKLFVVVTDVAVDKASVFAAFST